MHFMSRVRPKVALPFAGFLLVIGLLVLSGCTSSPSGSASNKAGAKHPTAVPSHGVSATVTGQSTAPLPADIPVPQSAQLQHEYTAQVNGKAVTVWQYTVPSTASATTPNTATTPNNVASFYEQTMPTKGWSSATAPAAPVTNGTAVPPTSAQVYHQNNTTTVATVTAAYANGNSGPVSLVIMIGK
jgi:hypothetical protein